MYLISRPRIAILPSSITKDPTVPREKNTTPSKSLHLMLPEPLLARLRKLVQAPNGEVPIGAYQKFFIQLLEKFFKRESRND